MAEKDTFAQRIKVNPRKGSNRVLRGGSWINNPQNCRVANRNNNDPTNRNNKIGFRLAASPSSSQARSCTTSTEQRVVPLLAKAGTNSVHRRQGK
ncbi:MAG: SUMF1/EgtB/PvdO family nonheme iron enzyme [Saprospiraceae bacterium]